MFRKILISSTLLLVPIFVINAAFFTQFKQFLVEIGGIVDTLKVIAVAAALLFFFWGLAQFISKSGDPSSHEEGRNKMVWGIIALFVIFFVMPIIYFIGGELGLYGTSAPAPIDNDSSLFFNNNNNNDLLNPPTSNELLNP